MSVTLTPVELKEIESLGTSNVAAHDAYLQGPSFYFRDTPVDNAKAEAYFMRAVELDPGFKRAYTILAKVYYKSEQKGVDKAYTNAMGIHPNHAIFLAHQNLAKSVDVDFPDPHVVRSWMALKKHQVGVALQEAQRALNLGLNDVDALKAQAKALIYSGQYAEGRKVANRVIRLDPVAPAEPLYLIGLSHFALGDYEEAVDYVERALKYDPTTSFYAGLLAAAYGKLGMGKQAKEAWLKYRNAWIVTPWIAAAVYTYPFQDGEVLKHLADGFESAGATERMRSRYMKLDRETKLTGQEIKVLLFGHTITGKYYWWSSQHWTQKRTVDGKVSHSGYPIHTGSRDVKEGESWIEDDRLCQRWPEVGEESTICVLIFRDSDGAQNNYYMVTDQGPHPFSVSD